jgi:CHAT domain-containing protein/tetratricopeptide (TPR) repeat protein
MKKIRLFLRSLYIRIGLGLLTFFLITTVLPVAAHYSLTNFPGKLAGKELKSKQLTNNLIAQNPSTLSQLEQGRTFYKAGRIAEAAAVWKQAAQGYDALGEPLNQALCLSYLASAYQDLGQLQDAQKAISQSLELITNNKQQTTNNKQILAQALNTQGSLQLAMGQTEAALNTWKQAENAYADAGDKAGMLGSQINQAQALQTLGLYRQAQTTLEQVNEKLQAQPNSFLKASGLQSLGVALQVVGDLQKSQAVLEQSLAITQSVDSSSDTSSILFSLGNTVRALQDYEKALELYQKAVTTATNPTTKVEAQLNQLSVLVQLKKWETAQALLPQIQSNLSNLPPSRATIYAQVNLAENLMKGSAVSSQESGVSSNQQQADLAEVLARAVQQARILKDPRAESYALGQLGKLYQYTQQWSEAQKLTQEALSLVQAINASDIAYRWQWQLGQILKQQENLSGAVAAYTEAVNTLKSIRSDLVTINPDVQFTFRDSVEPVYRELVELLLQPPSAQGRDGGNPSGVPSQENLEKARQVIESLQLAELDNFFREACLNAKPEQIDQVDPTAAVIYPIILPNRLAVILSLAGQPLRYYQTQLPQSEVERTLDQLLQSLSPFLPSKQRLSLSQQVYDWLIRPVETLLAESEVKTLVFVPDGSLRNLPMAALYDGKQYLVEKYSLALSQGLQLLQPRSLIRKQLKALTAGLTQARQGFAALPGVATELNQIASEVRSELLLNQQFTKKILEDQIQTTSFPIIHLATHGQFSSKAEETFLLTWDGRIDVKDLDRLLRTRERENTNPIELLVLSACQTATGDKRATLGLAGLAVRSGARSTLATLWSVEDRSTARLMSEFYRELIQTEVSKAEALRQAQLTLLKKSNYQHPFYWAPFILVGNWL